MLSLLSKATHLDLKLCATRLNPESLTSKLWLPPRNSSRTGGKSGSRTNKINYQPSRISTFWDSRNALIASRTSIRLRTNRLPLNRSTFQDKRSMKFIRSTIINAPVPYPKVHWRTDARLNLASWTSCSTRRVVESCLSSWGSVETSRFLWSYS